MHKYVNQLVVLVTATLLLWGFPESAVPGQNSDVSGLSDYPRIERFEQGSVKVDFPTIESWPDFRYLRAWLPVEHENNDWQLYSDGSWSTAERRKRGYELQNRPNRQEQQTDERWLPAHKRTLSRGELDRQELARIEGMDNYSKYQMEKEFAER